MYRIFCVAVFLLVIVTFWGCNKTGENKPRNNVTTDFYFNPNAYINSEVFFTIDNSAHNSLNWDFGDGNTHTTTDQPRHAYSKPGIYTVTVSSGSTATSKRIRVFPGTASFQIKSTYHIKLNSVKFWFFRSGNLNDVVSSPVSVKDLAQGDITDTIFVTRPAGFTYDPPMSTAFHYTNGRLTDVGFRSSNFSPISGTHMMFTISGETTGDYSYRLNATTFQSGFSNLLYTQNF
nr:PKD domain-containing protein [uncultured Mucilaginibacter sp.]